MIKIDKYSWLVLHHYVSQLKKTNRWNSTGQAKDIIKPQQSWVWGPYRRRATKEQNIAINCDSVNN